MQALWLREPKRPIEVPANISQEWAQWFISLMPESDQRMYESWPIYAKDRQKFLDFPHAILIFNLSAHPQLKFWCPRRYPIIMEADLMRFSGLVYGHTGVPIAMYRIRKRLDLPCSLPRSYGFIESIQFDCSTQVSIAFNDQPVLLPKRKTLDLAFLPIFAAVFTQVEIRCEPCQAWITYHKNIFPDQVFIQDQPLPSTYDLYGHTIGYHQEYSLLYPMFV